MSRSHEPLRAISALDDDDDTQSLLQSHSQAQARRRGSSFKQAMAHLTRLSICLAVVGSSCVILIICVLALFLAYFEPCLNPVLGNASFVDTFPADSSDLINIGVVASQYILIRTASDPQTNKLSTFVDLSAVSQEALEEAAPTRSVNENESLLSFQRTPLVRTLEGCSYEEVTLTMSPFTRVLNGTFSVHRGTIEARNIQNQFLSFSAETGSGQVVLGAMTCNDTLSLKSGGGSLKAGAIQSSVLIMATTSGPITLSDVLAEEVDLRTGEGLVSVSKITLLSGSHKCHASVTTTTGNIVISLIELKTTDICIISLVTIIGDVSVALKGFSGTFNVSTNNGFVNVPGFSACDGKKVCEGTANPGGLQNQQIVLATGDGSIELVFL